MNEPSRRSANGATPTPRERRGHVLQLGLLLAILLIAAAPVLAADRIVERQVVEDRNGSLEVADMAGLRFAEMPPILVAGYSPSTYWVKLTVRPQPGDTGLVLRAWPPYLDDLALYTPDGAGGWIEDRSGDRIPLVDRSSTGASLSFAIAPTSETTYYLRLATTSTSLLGIEVIPPTELFLDDLRFGIVNAVVLGLLLAVTGWATLEYAATRERLLLWYVASQAISVVCGLCMTGALALLVPWAQFDMLTSLMVWAAAFSHILFYLYLLREFSLPRGTTWLIAPLVLAGLAVPLLFLCGLWRIGLQLNALTVLAAPLIITVLAFVARGDAPPGRNVIRLVGLLHTGALLIGSLPVLGLTAATPLLWHGVLVHAALLSVIAFLILRARSRQMRRAAMELDLARRQFEVERREHDVRGRFLAVLSHELKTPLSVVSLSLNALSADGPERQRVTRAIESMTALIDLAAFAEQLQEGKLPVEYVPMAIGDLLDRVAAEPSARGRIRLQAQHGLELRTDPHLFDVVLRNLVDNALRYSPAESAVEVAVFSAQSEGRPGVSITVANRVNAAVPDPQRMFEKLYRGPGAASRSGLGLGLYVVRGIAELLGGTVAARLDDTSLRLEVWHPC